MHIRDEIEIARVNRRVRDGHEPVDPMPDRHYVPPEVHLLRDFRTWAITHHVPTDGRFGWTLATIHTSAGDDLERVGPHSIAVVKRGQIQGTDGYFSFDEVREAVIRYVARYDHPWPFDDDYAGTYEDTHGGLLRR